ncbi:MAG: glycogen synthase, partial [Pirellulales bacterium]|nr:glycogen synthase [Pirellulales bacterium]
GVPSWENAASVFTIHNLAFQGIFWHWDMLLTGMDWKYFNWQQMEHFGNLNLMKTGLTFADWITTVSPRYAEEIRTAEAGCGLESVLEYRANHLVGILNGVNYDEWNPATDEYLPANYSADDLSGKAICKAALQREFKLPERADVPLIGLVGRLSEQKGIDLAVATARHWATADTAQFVFLGTGDSNYQEALLGLAAKFPHLVGARIEFSNSLAHLLEAGSDIFLMPSRYEPCGLNQLYSLRYGTPPIVHATGGLANTVTNLSVESSKTETANGFSFAPLSQHGCNDAVGRALKAFEQPEVWRKLQTRGMRQDWSWKRSAEAYHALYRRAIASVRGNVASSA